MLGEGWLVFLRLLYLKASRYDPRHSVVQALMRRGQYFLLLSLDRSGAHPVSAVLPPGRSWC